MIIHFEDRDYEFDIEAMDLAEARHIKRQTGMTIRGLLEGMADLDPDALVAAYWLMLKQNGQPSDMNKVNYKVVKFGEALGKAFEEQEAKDEENPTEGATEATPQAA
jgi:hypothetical protein